MPIAKRLHLFLKVVPVVAGLLALKLLINRLGAEFISVDGLVPSLVAGAIFLIGFLLSHVMAHYKEAERVPGEMRAALEAIYDDIAFFEPPAGAGVDLAALRVRLRQIVASLRAGLGVAEGHSHLEKVETEVDALSGLFGELARLGMPEPYVVRLRNTQDTLRKNLYRLSYIQRIESVPSARLLVQTLVLACLVLILFIRTAGSYESFLILAFVSYLFVFALLLIQHLDEPFRTGEGTVDDVSLFLLSEFDAELAGEETVRESMPGSF